eukprot:GHVP01054546.1.p1 GENE.GHVP01054546.1~~GHVP01054546.1.p1  ORF type:complete len:123 (-),score=23.93 GHVP01054546.1:40-408(-)
MSICELPSLSGAQSPVIPKLPLQISNGSEQGIASDSGGKPISNSSNKSQTYSKDEVGISIKMVPEKKSDRSLSDRFASDNPPSDKRAFSAENMDSINEEIEYVENIIEVPVIKTIKKTIEVT